MGNSELYRAALWEAGDRSQFALTQAEPAAAGRLLDWAHAQFDKAGAQLAALAGHREGGVSIPAIQALGELMGLLHGAAAPKSIPLQTDWIDKVRRAHVCLRACAFIAAFEAIGTHCGDLALGAEGRQAVTRFSSPVLAPGAQSNSVANHSKILFLCRGSEN